MIKRLITLIISKFGINEKENALRNNSTDFVYEKDNKFFWYLKNFLYALILIIGISYIIVYVNLENSKNFTIPDSSNKLGAYLNESWIFILFGIIYILYSFKFLKSLYKHKDSQTHPNTYKNFKNSFSYSFWISMFIVCIVRIILAFTVERSFLHISNALALSNYNHDPAYYIANIFFILSLTSVFALMVFQIPLFILKPKMIPLDKLQIVDDNNMTKNL